MVLSYLCVSSGGFYMSRMEVTQLVLGMVSTNCYIFSNQDTKEVILIDPAAQSETIEEFMNQRGMIPKAILLTHGHFDHVMAASALANSYRIPIYASKHEVDLLEDPKLNLSKRLAGASIALIPDKLVEDNQMIELIGVTFQVIETPGHTKGSVCYFVKEENILFSGDTLFRESVGRTDFPTGNGTQLLQSIRQKLLPLGDEVRVYSGHGQATTIKYEKENNPYLNDSAFWD